jgi:plasmid stabilization system protein ParE
VKHRVRISPGAQADLERLFGFLVEHDLAAAMRAREAIETAYDLLGRFPFACRTASEGNPFLRELLVPFGSAGYVILFEIGEGATVTVAAIRHQREDDYR